MNKLLLILLLTFSIKTFSQDTLILKGRVLFIDTNGDKPSSFCPVVTSLLLVSLENNPIASLCKNAVVLEWPHYGINELPKPNLKIGRTYSFKIVKDSTLIATKITQLADPDISPEKKEIINAERLETCDDFVLRQRKDLRLYIIEVNGIKQY